MTNDPSRTRPRRPIVRLRSICMELPEATERLSHGEPTWFVRDRTVFVTTADHHHDDRVAMWCAAPPGVQEHLVAAEPDRFFRPPYVGHRGWLGVYLDVPVDWDEIAELVAELAALRASRDEALRRAFSKGHVVTLAEVLAQAEAFEQRRAQG